MKKRYGLMGVSAAMLLGLMTAGPALAQESTGTDEGVWTAVAGENGTTYANLFDVILAEEYYGDWYDPVAAVVGEENAAMMVDGLQGSISSTLYGEEAAEYFGSGENGMAFDCFYINDVASFAFKGNTVTTTLTDGSEETHTYEYLGSYLIGENETMTYQGQEISIAFPCDVYKSTDEAGEFNYFFLRDDTMETTYHIEFRYGKDLEELQGYLTGPYGYWLAAGIDADADEETIEAVTELFCLENMDYSTHTDAALSQLADLGFTGKWVADLSEFGEDFADTELYFTLDENGHGETWMDGAQTRDFEAYAFDSGEAGDGKGIYVAYDNMEYEPEAADYVMQENEEGQCVLTLIAKDGVISYIRDGEMTADCCGSAAEEETEGEEAEEDAAQAEAGAQEAEVIEIATAEDLAAVNENLSASYILTADIDLEGQEWTPIGTFAPAGESEEEQEIPHPDYAFTGTFDGAGHIISNLVVSDEPDGYTQGLFGCISGADVGNFTLSCALVYGGMMSADVVGYSFMSNVHDVTLEDGVLTAGYCELSDEGMFAGIVGAGMGGEISDCTASAQIILPDHSANAGIVGGGLEMTTVSSCTATGSITAGSNCYGIGGVSGCAFGAATYADSVASNVKIVTGDNAYVVGGVVGYTGGYENEMFGVPVTAVTGCVASGVTIETGENANAVGGIVGGGFYEAAVAEAYGAPYDAPSVFVITDCESDTTVNGEAVEMQGVQEY